MFKGKQEICLKHLLPVTMRSQSEQKDYCFVECELMMQMTSSL